MTDKKGTRSWPEYFKHPFPNRGGFSPYRFPGLAVHIPAMSAFVTVGYQMNTGLIWFFPALAVYGVAGFYWGRDLAVHAHYNLFVLLAIGAFFVACQPWLLPILAHLQRSPSFPLVSAIADAAVLLGFAAHVARTGHGFLPS